MKATIYDVANASGLSVATISRYINHKGTVKKKNEEKILRAIELLNYVPDAAPQGLATGISGTMGMQVNTATLQTHYMHQFMMGAFKAVREFGYDLLMIQLEGDVFKCCNEVLTRNRMDGIIFPDGGERGEKNHKYLQALYEKDFPVVYAGERYNWDKVGCNIYGGFSDYRKDALNLLIDRGCCKILCIELDAVTYSQMQNLVLETELQGKILDIVCYRKLTKTQIYEEIYQMLKSNNRPDAILFVEYEFGGCIYAAAASAGLRIPEDLKLISTIHAEEQAGMFIPNTTAIFINAYQMGYQSGKKVCMIRNKKPLDQKLDSVGYEIRLNQTVGYK